MHGKSTASMDASGEYKRVEIETASPAKLLLMLYDAAIHRCESAAEGMRDDRLEAAHLDLVRAQDILTELMVALDPEAADAPVKELFALYEYMHRSLVAANIHKQPERVTEVAALLGQLRAAWAEAAGGNGRTAPGEGSPPRARLDLQT